MQKNPLANRISIVVLTRNRADELIATLERLLALPENPPIFVADNASDDNTVALVKALFPTVCVIECEGNLGAAGRNRAAQCVGTDYVAFCDDDTWWEPGALERAVQLLDAWPDVGVLSARVTIRDEESGEQSTAPVCVSMRASPLGSDGLPGPALTAYLPGACVFRTALFREIGGYEARLFMGGEEELLALDVLASGQAIVYCEQLSAQRHCSDTSAAARQRCLLARNAAWTAWLRLPWMQACHATLRAFDVFAREGAFLRDSADLLRGLRWALANRVVVSAPVLAQRERVRRGALEAAAVSPSRVMSTPATSAKQHRRHVDLPT